jgi:hypothetical protein
MAFSAQVTFILDQHASSPGAMGLVASHAFVRGRHVGHLGPLLCGIAVALDAEHAGFGN